MHDAEGKSRTKISSESTSGWSEYVNHLSCLKSIQPRKSELDMYLQESCSISDIDKGRDYDVLEWWKMHSFKYKILSRMAIDILSIPMNTTSCDATSRVIDKYCASSTSDMVRVVMCGGDWLRKYIGAKNKFKSVKEAKQVIFPVDVDDGSSEG